MRLVLWLWTVGGFVGCVSGAFTSLYVFGDGVCTTTNNPSAGPYYYGLRRTNGRVWIEVLAQRLGIPYEPHNNWSFYGHYSSNLVVNVRQFAAPPDAGTALFIIWVNDADFVDWMGRIFPSTNIVAWTNAMNQSLSNHFVAITNLYHAKGARTLVLPNAVDITTIPQYNLIASAPHKAFVRQRIQQYNAAFAGELVPRLKAHCPELTVYVADAFGQLDQVLTNAAAYGLTNALYRGQPIDALGDPSLTDKSLNGPGAHYIFWDPIDPTAKVHTVLADYVHQLIAPVRIGAVTAQGASLRLELVNVPIGRNGSVQAAADAQDRNWVSVQPIASTNATLSVWAPVSGPLRFYRLCFPFSWTWP